MRIKSISVNNFKSLVNFYLPLSKFNCIVGLNGSGKSSILQFFDFLAQQVKGEMDQWLKQRHWEPSDIHSKLTPKKNVEFRITFSSEQGNANEWRASFNTQTLRCTNERIIWNGKNILKVESGYYTIPKNESKELDKIHISFDYQGSLMSQIKEELLPPDAIKLKHFFKELHALDLLAPELLRQRTRKAGNSLGLGGERLSAFLYEAKDEKRQKIEEKLKKCYPNLVKIESVAMRSGWKKLIVHEIFNNKRPLKTEARHVADGFLRMLAIFAQLSNEQSFLLLDEIENGINLELIESLLDVLVEATPQILVSTHSPVILNYIEDSVAIESVIYIYKDTSGGTKAIKLFDIPSMKEKLTVMGPGEAYEDTSLTEFYDEIIQHLESSDRKS